MVFKFALIVFVSTFFVAPRAQAVPRCAQLQNPLCLFKLLEKEEFIGAIRVQNLTPTKGRFLTVFYVVGEKPMGGSDSDLIVHTIKHVVPSILVTENSVTLPTVDLQVTKDEPGYNYVIFAFHNEAQFFWTNSNNEHPDDPRFRMGAVYMRNQPASVKIYSKSQLFKLATAQNHPSEVVVRM